MRSLTKETKQKLSNLLLIDGSLAKEDHLIAALAVIALTYRYDLTTTDYISLHNTSLLSAAYYNGAEEFVRNKDFFVKEDGVSDRAFGATFDFVIEKEKAQIDWLFDLTEELVANLDDNDNADVLKAIKAFVDAQKAVEAAIKARKEKRAITKAEEDIDIHGKTARVLGLPALTGSIKQIAWAEKIREKCLKIYPEEKIGRAARTATTAKYWIDNYKQVLN